jgi:Flp pilus assembly protein TadD
MIAGTGPMAKTMPGAQAGAPDLFSGALQAHRAGNLADAIAGYREALALMPGSAELRNCLGSALGGAGDLAGAVAQFRSAVALDPAFGAAHANLAHALAALGEHDAAAAAFRQALSVRVDDPALLHGLGDSLLRSNRPDEAIAAFRRSLALRPDAPETCTELAGALLRRGEAGQAVALCCKALEVRPDHAGAYQNLGAALWTLGRLDDAVVCFRHFATLRPDDPAGVNGLGVCLKDMGRAAEAEAVYRAGLARFPQEATLLNNLAIALSEQGRFGEAEEMARQARARDAAAIEAVLTHGNVLLAQGRLPEAIVCYRDAVEADPAHAPAHQNLAMALLANGELREGWLEYEWRWQMPEGREAARDFAQPQWRGEPDAGGGAGRTILVHAEQGFGDTLQFCRYVPMLAARGFRVVFEVQGPLKRLLGGLPGVAALVARGDPLPRFDLHCPLLSLPLAFGTELGSIPASQHYLAADPAAAAGWAARLANCEGLRVGIVWGGNARAHSSRFAAIDRRRSAPAEAFGALADIPGVTLFSLQKDRGAAPAGVFDFTDEIGDFADTAALIANLDLVVSVDTSVAHLAGALGKPVWLLDRFDPCWRWLRDRACAPWYPTMRIFRQQTPGDWDDVFRRVRAELAARAAQGVVRAVPA